MATSTKAPGSLHDPPGRRPHPAWTALKRRAGSGALTLVPDIALLAGAVYLFWLTGRFRESEGGPGAAFYPRVLIVLLAACALARVVQKLLAMRRGQPGDPATADTTAADTAAAETAAADTGADESPRVDPARLATGMLLVIGYVVATLYLGYPLATAVFVPVFLYVAGRRRLWITLPLGIATAAVFSYVFLRLVYISLPTGVGIFDRLTVALLTALGIY
ncbi:MAG: tripartite tricarboxylate transporter TctB family protein [Carbonactinosporaceae bacterium]